MFNPFHRCHQSKLQSYISYHLLRRSVTFSSQNDITKKMKHFNDQQDFQKALSLFDLHKDQDRGTDRMFVQALKACARLKWVERGQMIHQEIPKSLLSNGYVQAALISFYSSFILLVKINSNHSIFLIPSGVWRSCQCSTDLRHVHGGKYRCV